MKYVGCFEDAPHRVLNGKLIDSQHVTNQMCVELCLEEVRNENKNYGIIIVSMRTMLPEVTHLF